jgi:hypothetical protein
MTHSYSVDVTIKQLMVGGALGLSALAVGAYRLSKQPRMHVIDMAQTAPQQPLVKSFTLSKAEKPAIYRRNRTRDASPRV